MPEKPQAPSSEETSAPEGAAKPKPANKKDKAQNNSRLKCFDTLEVVEVTIYPDGYEDQKDQKDQKSGAISQGQRFLRLHPTAKGSWFNAWVEQIVS